MILLALQTLLLHTFVNILQQLAVNLMPRERTQKVLLGDLLVVLGVELDVELDNGAGRHHKSVQALSLTQLTGIALDVSLDECLHYLLNSVMVPRNFDIGHQFPNRLVNPQPREVEVLQTDNQLS